MGARAQAIATIRLEEPHVRVTEYRFPPEAETGWHRHGHDYVVVPLRTGRLLLEQPDGTSSTAELLMHQQLGGAQGAVGLFQQQPASPQWDDDIVVAVPVPAGLSLGRKAILRDPNVRLLEPDRCDRLCTGAHRSPPVRQRFLKSRLRKSW